MEDPREYLEHEPHVGRRTVRSVGLVAELWRFPVKSMGGERLDEALITPQGVLGDRAFALLDVETNSIVSASNKHFPGLLDWRATYLEPPRLNVAVPVVRIAQPSGTPCTTDDPAIDAWLSGHFRRDVTLVRERSAAYATKQAAFFAGVGLEDIAPTMTLVDFCPVSVITSATLAELRRVRPEGRFDARRFRMNINLDSTGSGFEENDWVGSRLSIGNHVGLRVALPDPRCSMTTLAQGELEKDPAILRTIAEVNSLPVGSGGPQPCAGVYATVAEPGEIRKGDAARLAVGAW